MPGHGRLREFNAASENWSEYVERLEQYCIANDIEDAGKKRAILLSVVGATTYHLMRSLTAPTLPSEKTYAELVELMKKHHDPPPSVTVQRHKFNTHVRHQGESVADFLAALKTLSEHCKFGDSLEDMLRDRLVCGINDRFIQRKAVG